MDVHATNGIIVQRMILTGLGIGVSMSLFTIIVQNAFSRDMIGQVTSSLTFFRSLGSSIGVAVLGALVTNAYSSKVASTVPAALKPYVDAGKLANQSTASKAVNVQDAIAHLGPQQFHQLALQLATNVKGAFSSSVTLAFAMGAGMMVLALIAAFFLREIPLTGRASTTRAGSAAGEVAPEPVAEVIL